MHIVCLLSQDKWPPVVPISIRKCKQVSSSPSTSGSSQLLTHTFSLPQSFPAQGHTSLLPFSQIAFLHNPSMSATRCLGLCALSTPGSRTLLLAPSFLCLLFLSPSPPTSPLMAGFSLLAMVSALLSPCALGSSRCLWHCSPSYLQ